MESESKRSIYLQILLISLSVLFLELALIRWLPANIYSLAFFSNLVLLATFYGFGLGNLVGGGRLSLIKPWPFYLLGFVGLVVLLREFNVLVPEGSIEWIWSRYREDQLHSGRFKIPLEIALVSVFFIVALLFVPFGQRLAQLMGRVESLAFYQFDLIGSLIGITLFSFLSAAGTPPSLWFAVIAALAIPLLFVSTRRKIFLYALPLVAAASLVWHFGRGEIWSPYYSIITKGHASGVLVFVNRLYHQQMIDFRRTRGSGYALPYRFFHGGSVLIVGAGTGNDVGVALQHGARSVDAVEIDPAILALGDHHPLKPYSDPRVTVHVEDARTFLQNSSRRYDLVLFGTLDSHALLSSVSTLRLDNYVYTLESLRSARRCLKDDGVLAMLYSVPNEGGKILSWIRDRLLGIAVETFGHNRVLGFVSRSSALNLVVIAKKNGTFDHRWARHLVPPPDKKTVLPTDDWPFLYLKERALPAYHLKTIPVILVIGAIPLFFLLPTGRKRPHWNFLALGAAFLLMETTAITRLSLLFGSTWIVNSVVFFAILLMVLLANFVVRRTSGFPVHLVYLALCGALLLNYLVSVEKLLYSSIPVKVGLSVIFAGLPIFFAGIIFSQLFKREDSVQYAFGSNLLGAFLGGFCEYVGMVTGFNDLILLIIAFYLVSYLLTLRGQRVAH